MATVGLPAGVGSAWLHVVFLGTALLAGLTILLSHLRPGFVLRWNSMPWAFQQRRLLDLPFHRVVYATYHTTWAGRATHWLASLDAAAWFLLLAAVHPLLLLACLLLLGWRSERVAAPRALGLCWLALSGAGLWLLRAGGAWAVTAAEAELLGSALLRFAGHGWEPLPPMIAERSDRFLPLREAHLGARVLALLPVGFLSEFTAGLPWHLFPVQVAWLVDLWRHRGRAPGWARAAARARAIHARGFCAWPPMAAHLQPYLSIPPGPPRPGRA